MRPACPPPCPAVITNTCTPTYAVTSPSSTVCVPSVCGVPQFYCAPLVYKTVAVKVTSKYYLEPKEKAPGFTVKERHPSGDPRLDTVVDDTTISAEDYKELLLEFIAEKAKK